MHQIPYQRLLVITFLLVVTLSLGWQVQHVSATAIMVSGSNDSINIDGVCSLSESIINANNDNQSGSTDCPAGFGADIITLTSDVFVTGANTEFLHGTNGLPIIRTDITIEGNPKPEHVYRLMKQ